MLDLYSYSSIGLMLKYTGKTYSKARKREAKSAAIFDDVQVAETSTSCTDTAPDTSKTPFGSSLPKKSSWSRVHKAVVHTQENSPTKPKAKGSKRRFDTIDEDDPFAFTDDDQSTSLPSSQTSQKSVDPSDKSTDDEAYSSSQESISEKSAKLSQSLKRAKRSTQSVS